LQKSFQFRKEELILENLRKFRTSKIKAKLSYIGVNVEKKAQMKDSPVHKFQWSIDEWRSIKKS
jgi:hypothetical protein